MNSKNKNFKPRTYNKETVWHKDALNYYNIMGLEPSASGDDIKLAYRQKAKELHPDYNKTPDAEFRFRFLKAASDILSDNLLRNIYDIKYLSEYVTTDSRKFNLDFKRCSKCGCVSPQLRIMKNDAYNKALCYACARKVGKKDVDVFKSLLLTLEQMLSFITAEQYDNAVITAKQALLLTDDESIKTSLNNIVAELDAEGRVVHKNQWKEPFNFLKYKKEALIISSVSGAVFLILLAIVKYQNIADVFSRLKVPEYNAVQDNVIGQNVLAIPVDIKDEKMIYHTRKESKVFHGPSTEYDLLRVIEKETTVRLTGMTVDSSWARIMMPDGIVGFIDRDYLKKGFGKKPLPLDNIIFDTTPLNSEGK
ncbi:MAG: DnaJ domain-containing protein [Alphaproteobacteria bacterium]